jgi:hypothetical protein
MKILTPFALIVLLFFNSSCEKDLYEDAVYQPEKSIIKYGIQENQLKSEPVFNDVKNQFTSIVNSNNSKSNNTSFFDLEQDLINRLDLEKTHLNSIGNKQVLNAPIKTFGSYKRALLALKNNQHTSAYIITYPNPENDAIFYVANLQGKLLQKVAIQANGIGLVEYFNDTNANTSNKENQNTTYNSGCSETVYVTCSKGIHSFDLGNVHECHYWNNLSQGTPPRVFSIACGDSGGSGGNDNYDPNDNPFETGNGNPNDNPFDGSDNNSSGGVFSTVPSQNGSNPDGISNCITNIDCPDCNLQNDINNDCNLDANEIMFNAFYNNSLNNRQQLFLDINVTTKNNIFNYLKNQNWSNESQVFAKELIDLAISNNLLSFFPNFKYPVGSNYSTLYPKLTEYLKNKIPELKNNQFIINKLVQYSELSSQQVINDLKWDQGPTIQIAQLDSRGVDCYGIFSSATPSVLTIDIDFVNLLENSTPGPGGDSLAFLLGVTILHEYVHLGDFVDGIDQPGEEGLLFEQATYGETIWLNNAGDVLIKWQ